VKYEYYTLAFVNRDSAHINFELCYWGSTGWRLASSMHYMNPVNEHVMLFFMEREKK